MALEPDAEVVSRSLADPSAFGEIFDRHGATMLRFLGRRVGREVAEDLLGELFRVAFERRGAFDARSASARPWLYGIATNLLRREWRAEARRLRATARLLARRESPSTAGRREVGAADARVLWRRVADATASLPDEERDALLLFAWEELGYGDIAAALGVPVGTVRSRLHRARARLREAAEAAPARRQPAAVNRGRRRR
jgi:RNA polymerase sigma-70 factor (ECF subfamily)